MNKTDFTSLADTLAANGVVVVGISGKMGSGKTTLCDRIKEHYKSMYGENVQVDFRNFADALKEQVSSHFGFPLQWCYSQLEKNNIIGSVGKSVGELLQIWGTGLRNSVHESVWLIAVDTWLRTKIHEPKEDSLERRKRTFSEMHDLDTVQKRNFLRRIILIGDVRFPNEFNYIRENCGGILVRLNGDPAGERANSNRDLEHISETALDDLDLYAFDLVIDSNKTGISESCAAVVDKLHVYAQQCISNCTESRLKYFKTRLQPFLSAIFEFRKSKNGEPFQQPARLVARAMYEDCFAASDIDVLLFEPQQWNDLEKFVEDFAVCDPCSMDVPSFETVMLAIGVQL